jgi:branched-chain amino acid transport system permease protein
MVDLTTVIQAGLTGLMQGGVYALLSIGLTIIFGVMGIINFAQADFMMLGMYAAFVLFVSFAVSPLIAFFLLLIPFFIAGMGVQKWLINPILDEQEDAQLILTFGILLILQNVALTIFGPSPRTINVPISRQAFVLGPFTLNQAKTIAFVFAMAIAVVVFLFLKYSEFGRAMRATSNNPTVASYAGINVDRIYLAAFGLGIAITAGAGALLLTYFPVTPTVGFTFIVIMFVVVVLGGLGSVRGAVVAGLALGVVENMSTIWIPLELQPAVIFVIFLLVLLVKPEGLFGTASREV